MPAALTDIKKYQSFFYSHYLSEGIRMTVGIALPAVVLSQFGQLGMGIGASLGALCVSITDTPGPVHHRVNGMLACLIAITLVSFITGITAPYPILMGVLIVVCCFLFSMIGVFGSRSNSVGVAALLIMVLHLDRVYTQHQMLLESLYILAGGAWYMGLSLLLYSFRPYRLSQQALGECISSIAAYLRNRASFYLEEVDYEKANQQMLELQIDVHEKQELLRELLFKSRNIVKESTPVSRALVLIFRESVDLFEKAMTSYQDYRELHKNFDGEGILPRYHKLILLLADELDNIALALKSGRPSKDDKRLQKTLRKTRQFYLQLRDRKRNPENFEAFIGLRHILFSIEDFAEHVESLHLYTSYNQQLFPEASPSLDYNKFVSPQTIDFRQLLQNLDIHSNFLRHAIRVSTATLLGYIIAKLLPFGHSYWILLTIIVILKPAYSLTKKRNYERLLGTIGGALTGLLILHFVHDRTILFVLMLFLMVGTYSLLRIHYMISVIFMTPFILILFDLIYAGSFKSIFQDRLIDTIIGSAIAFVINALLLPAWEQSRMKEYMRESIQQNIHYFKDVAATFTGAEIPLMQYKLSRKNAFVALANLSDTFSRMLAEPKKKQTNARLIHGFVVNSHQLTSHIATLAYFSRQYAGKYSSHDFVHIIQQILSCLETAYTILGGENTDSSPAVTASTGDKPLDEKVNSLLEQRKEELQQGMTRTPTRTTLSELKSIVDQFHLVSKIAGDIKKISRELQNNETSVTVPVIKPAS